MKEYISTIIYICIFSVILQLILPENKLKKYIGVLVSLIILLTLISPVIDMLEMDNVIAVISNTLEDMQSNIEVKEHASFNMNNKIVFSSTKKSIEQEIYIKCIKKFNTKFGVSKVKISLNDEYVLNNVDVYVKDLPEVSMAAEIIDYIADEFQIEAKLINVIREE